MMNKYKTLFGALWKYATEYAQGVRVGKQMEQALRPWLDALTREDQFYLMDAALFGDALSEYQRRAAELCLQFPITQRELWEGGRQMAKYVGGTLKDVDMWQARMEQALEYYVQLGGVGFLEAVALTQRQGKWRAMSDKDEKGVAADRLPYRNDDFKRRSKN